MKITDVKALVLRQTSVDDSIADGSQDGLVVLIETDDGIVGIGEVDSAPEVVKAAFDAPNSHANAMGLRNMLIGADPYDPELWSRLYRGSVYYGRRGVAIHAMSGVDLALWDIKGKHQGKPVSQLLGTPLRDKVKAYASTLMPDTPEAVAARVVELGAMGFRAIKFGWGPIGKDEKLDFSLVNAAAEASEGRIEILIDAGLGFDGHVDRAIRFARELERLGMVWLEEPFNPDSFEQYAELADAVDIDVTAGEHESTWWGFRELIERGHIDLAQPDVTRCGGLGEALRIADLARDHGIKCVPHAWKSGIIKAASLHLNAVLPVAYYQEYCVADTLINKHLVKEAHPLDAEGFVAVPTAPGLGVTLDRDVLEKLTV